MTKTTKTRPSTAIPGRVVETGDTSQMTTASNTNSTTPAAENQTFRVADLLSPGAENAISRRDLMALTGLRDRELRRQIEVERRQGVPICANNKTGYYLPGSDLERAECVKSMRHRSAEIARTAAAIEKAVIR